MNVVIVTETLPFSFRWSPKRPQRGTDVFYVQTAEAALRLDPSTTVTVVYDGPDARVHGVQYINRASLPETAFDRADKLILCNPRATDDFAAVSRLDRRQVTIWTNFAFPSPDHYLSWLLYLPDHGDLVVISPYAASLLPTWIPFEKRHLIPRIVPHGIDHSFWEPTRIGRERKRQVAFTSSPDRGLDVLVRAWQDYDLEESTGYSLKTTTYGQSSGMSKDDVRELLAESDFWVHPGVGTELFCLSAVEAQAMGCTPIVVPTGGLATTVRHGYRFPAPWFAEGLAGVLAGQALINGINAAHIPSWEAVTACLLDGRTSIHI